VHSGISTKLATNPRKIRIRIKAQLLEMSFRKNNLVKNESYMQLQKSRTNKKIARNSFPVTGFLIDTTTVTPDYDW
jgi:hypothetical protein